MSLARDARYAALAEKMRLRVVHRGETFNGAKLWSKVEDEVLRAHYPDYKTMMEKLPKRTKPGIRKRCAVIGIIRKIHVWTTTDISRVRQLYPWATREEICAAIPDSTWSTIGRVASQRGIRRPQRPYKPTGFIPLDEIRAKCFECRLSMRDLDDLAGTNEYFRKMQWRGRRSLNYEAMGKALSALGGKLTVVWKY